MKLVEIQNQTLYIKETDNGYEVCNPFVQVKGTKLYTLSKTELDSNGDSIGNFFHVPKTIFSSDVVAFYSKVEAGFDFNAVATSSTALLYVNGFTVNFTFDAGNAGTIALAVSAINSQITAQLGSIYSNFASYSGNRITIQSPIKENSYIEVIEGVFTLNFGLIEGVYPGDIPFPEKLYTDEIDEAFILFIETVTPNNGESTGKFYPLIKKNRLLDYVSEFDRNLIITNPRLSTLFDSYAYMVGRIDGEMSSFIDQLDLTKIDPSQIEYVAYLFGLDLSKLLRENGTLSAREVLRSIMRIIHIKGTIASFEICMRFVGFNSTITEYYKSLDPVTNQITTDIIENFYERYLFRDSEYRNPILSFGSFVSTVSDLPATGFENEYIKVLDVNKFYVYNSGWQPAMNIDRILGKGTDPAEWLSDLDFRMKYINTPYLSIGLANYNNLRILNGLDVLPGNVSLGYDEPLYDIQSGTNRAELQTTNKYPFNLSGNIVFQILANGRLFTIDFNQHKEYVEDLSAVTYDELKFILETNIPELVVIENAEEYLQIRSKRSGTGSWLKIINPSNFVFGALENKVYRPCDRFKILTGSANPSDAELAIPQNVYPTQERTIKSPSNTAPLDGYYYLYALNNGNIAVVSKTAFWQAIYDVSFGYVSEVFEYVNAKPFAEIQVINGEFAYIKQYNRQSDFIPETNLNTLQTLAVQSFIRGKETVSGRLGTLSPFTIIEEGFMPSDINQPFYLRNEIPNANNTNDPNLSNRIKLVLDQISSGPWLSLTDNLVGQVIEFIKFLRPVHIRIIELVFQAGLLNDEWPKVYHRTEEGDYDPGFWNGSQQVTKVTEEFIAGVTGINTFALKYGNSIAGDSQSNILGKPTDDPALYNSGLATINDIELWVNGTSFTANSINPTTGTFTINGLTIGDVVLINYWIYDFKRDYELDIVDSLEYARKFDSDWFTNGDVYSFATPPSGDNLTYEYIYQTNIPARQYRQNQIFNERYPMEYPLLAENRFLSDGVRTTPNGLDEYIQVPQLSRKYNISNRYRIDLATPYTSDFTVGSNIITNTGVIARIGYIETPDIIYVDLDTNQNILTAVSLDTYPVATGVIGITTIVLDPSSTNRVIIQSMPIVGETIVSPLNNDTITFTLGGTDYTYTFKTSPVGIREVQRTSNAFTTFSNLVAKINLTDGAILTASITGSGNDFKVTIIDDTGIGLAVRDTMSANTFVTCYSEYLSIKKPTISDDLMILPIGIVNDPATSLISEQFMNTANVQLPYYRYNYMLHRGSTISSDLEPIWSSNAILFTDTPTRGYTGFLNPGDDLLESETRTLSQVRLSVPYYRGSEKYDGGGKTGILNQSDQYTDFVTPSTGRHFRGFGVHNSEHATVLLVPNFAIASTSGTGITATATTSVNHTFLDGQYVTITDTTSFNGIYQISNVTANTFDFANAAITNETGNCILNPTLLNANDVVPIMLDSENYSELNTIITNIQDYNIAKVVIL